MSRPTGFRSAYRLRLAIILSVVALLSLTSAGFIRSAAQSETIPVVATTGMVADLVRLVGGERVTVAALMGPGVDPHLYRATASDIQTLQRANIIFYSGLNLEAKLAEILDRLSSRLPTYAVAGSLPTDLLLGEPQYPDQFDPHVWFDVSLWAQAIDVVEKGLSGYDAAHTADYKARADELRTRLAALDEYVKAAIASIPEQQRLMITAHDAFRYYGQRYGLEVTGLQGISTEAEAGVEDVRRLVNLIVEREIPAIFVESSIPVRNVEAVVEAAKARGQEVRIGGQLFSDAMGDEGTPEGTYIGMVLHNTVTITRSLGGEPPALPQALADYQPILGKE